MAAEQRLDAALRDAEALRGEAAAARSAAAAGTAEVARLAAEMAPLAEAVTAARQRWGDHVPAGPSQAETEDPALIEWRETMAPWADEEYANARAQVFVAALELHKALIAARAEVFEANLAALMELISADPGPAQADRDSVSAAPGSAGAPDGDRTALDDVLLAAWRSFFLVVPVVRVPFEAAGSLFDGLGPGALGWLLAGAADQLPAGDVPGLTRRFDRAVFAGDTRAGGELPLRHLAAGRAAGRRLSRAGSGCRCAWCAARTAAPSTSATTSPTTACSSPAGTSARLGQRRRT